MKHARARARAHEVGKGNRRINAPSRSTRRSGHSILASAAFRLRVCDRNLICGEHYGQRPKISAASTGRTHGSTDQLCITVKKIPCQQGAVHTWLEATFGPCRRYVRFTPDSRPSSGNVCFAPDFVCFTPRCGPPRAEVRHKACSAETPSVVPSYYEALLFSELPFCSDCACGSPGMRFGRSN